MSHIKRIPFILNLEDPVDQEIWEALAPLLTRHRASAFIRSAVAQALSITGGGKPTLAASRLLPSPQALRSFSTEPPVVEYREVLSDGIDEAALDMAKNNFLDMFG